jgi:hypothetical protein
MEMRELGGTTVTRGVVVAMLSVGVAAGSFALSSMQRTLAQIAELTPAQTVAYRFPSNWHTTPPAQTRLATAAPASTNRPTNNPPAARAAVASLFNPQPTFGLASASSTTVTLPDNANAYADTSADSSAARRPAAGERVAVATPQAERPPADKPNSDKAQNDKSKAGNGPANAAREVKQSNNVFNDAQIASIKSRLKLTADQQRNWPAVESALRNITYKKDAARGGKSAAVDPNSAGVQQLKAAAMPMLFSFSEEQKNEVRQLARLMGLEQVASSF